jgi:hypothetical protein
VFQCLAHQVGKETPQRCRAPGFQSAPGEVSEACSGSGIADSPGGAQNRPGFSLRTLQGVAVADYLEAHARRIYSAVLRPDMAAARELAKHLRRGDLPERFRLREVYRKGWTGLSNKEDAEAAAEILCDLNWIRFAVDAQSRPPGTPGRAASQMFEVNPKILRHPLHPADTTDTINSDGSVSGVQGVYEKSSTDFGSSVSDHPGETEESSTPIAGDEKGVGRL